MEFRRHLGVPARDVVIHNGVDPEWFTPAPANASPPDAPYVLAVGNGFPHKNLSRLICAMDLVHDRTRAKLFIVGNFDGLRHVDTDAIHLAQDRPGHVKLLGKLSFPELRAWMAGASALAFPSIYEGFGLPPLEALASGVPVAVSDIAVHREIYDGIAHFMDPFDTGSIADAIALALADRAPRANREAFARRFDWDSCAEAHLKFVLASLQA